MEYSQDDPSFNQKLALLLNSVIQSRITKNVLFKDENVLVKRGYIFQEEIVLRDFACIIIPKFVGINDEDIYKQDTPIDSFYGYALDDDGTSTEMTVKSENYIRLESIVIFGKQYMKFNRCGIKLNKETGQYNIPPQLTKPVTIKSAPKKIITLEKINPNRGILKLKKKLDKESTAVKAKDDAVLSFEEIEARLKDDQQRQTVEWGYSGSSAVAPSNITVKPSFCVPASNSPVTENTELTPVLPSENNLDTINSNDIQLHSGSRIVQAPMDMTFENVSIRTQNPSIANLNQESENRSNGTIYNHPVPQNMMAYPPGISPPAAAPISNYGNKSLVDTSFNSIPGVSQDMYFNNVTYPMGYTSKPDQYLSQPFMVRRCSGYPFQTQMVYPSNIGRVQPGTHLWQNDHLGNSGPYASSTAGIIPQMSSNLPPYSNQFMPQGYPTFHSPN